jgi:hypothetical protein
MKRSAAFGIGGAMDFSLLTSGKANLRVSRSIIRLGRSLALPESRKPV